ncbi:MAG: hypothetical protein EBR09_09440 [Proteobacteria bacterium]|nr:hypothetical protein [Pseudomonadota bacterium]
MGISPAGVEQLLPTAFHFEQDSMLPDVLLTLNSGDTMPQIVNGSDLSLKVFAINNATSFTYKLVDGNVDCFSQKEDTFPKPSVIENDVSITLTAGELKRDIISTDPRKLKTLCVLSFKQGPENSIVKNMKVFAFFVDISGFTLPESGVTGIPANPTIESDFLNVKIMPSAGGSSFNKATSKTYQRVDVFDTREKALAPCSFDSVIPESFKDVIELKGHAKKGFYRLCLKIENSAKTAAVQRFGWIREDVVASLPLTNDKTFNRPNLANQDATSPNVLKTLTGLPKQDKASGNKFEFKFKHYVGLTLCHDNKDPYSPLASDQIDIKNLPAAGSFHTLCVLATLKGPDGTVLASQENASRFTWLRDGTKPDHTVSGIPAGTNNDTVFKVKFSAAREGKSYSPDLDAIVVLRTEILDKEAQCPARTVKDNNNKDILNPLYKEVKLNTASGEADVELTRALTAADNKKDLMFCSYSRDKSGNVASLVRMNSWTFDTRPFASLAFDPSVKMGQPSNKKTVEISVIRNPDHKGYKSKLISGLNCGTIDAGYTAFTPTTTDASFLKKTLDVSAGGDGDRTFCILAIANDNANTLQPVAEPTAFSWKLDTTPTSVELVKAPENSNLAKVDFKLTVKTSVSSESAVSYSYIALGSTTADCEKSLSSERTVKDFKTQLTLTSTLPSGAKSGSFKLCLWGHDSAGNISAAKSYTWTQKLP